MWRAKRSGNEYHESTVTAERDGRIWVSDGDEKDETREGGKGARAGVRGPAEHLGSVDEHGRRRLDLCFGVLGTRGKLPLCFALHAFSTNGNSTPGRL